jgi:hypothetical protein
MAITGKPVQNPAYRPSGSFDSRDTPHHQLKNTYQIPAHPIWGGFRL